jgi:hypothetical protein
MLNFRKFYLSLLFISTTSLSASADFCAHVKERNTVNNVMFNRVVVAQNVGEHSAALSLAINKAFGKVEDQIDMLICLLTLVDDHERDGWHYKRVILSMISEVDHSANMSLIRNLFGRYDNARNFLKDLTGPGQEFHDVFVMDFYNKSLKSAQSIDEAFALIRGIYTGPCAASACLLDEMYSSLRQKYPKLRAENFVEQLKFSIGHLDRVPCALSEAIDRARAREAASRKAELDSQDMKNALQQGRVSELIKKWMNEFNLVETKQAPEEQKELSPQVNEALLQQLSSQERRNLTEALLQELSLQDQLALIHGLMQKPSNSKDKDAL